ncbi:hypothetical protein GCM10027436_50890 [Actinophytocola sediminis]
MFAPAGTTPYTYCNARCGTEVGVIVRPSFLVKLTDPSPVTTPQRGDCQWPPGVAPAGGAASPSASTIPTATTPLRLTRFLLHKVN